MLVDTSGFLCYLHQSEAQHQQAVQLLNNINTKIVTHSYILAELIALALVRRFPRTTVLNFAIDLLENPDVETVWVDASLHREAMQLLIDRSDKTYSLCDAVSFVLMRQRGITEALTTDRPFTELI